MKWQHVQKNQLCGNINETSPSPPSRGVISFRLKYETSNMTSSEEDIMLVVAMLLLEEEKENQSKRKRKQSVADPALVKINYHSSF